MKKTLLLLQMILIGLLSLQASSVYAKDNKKVTHVVMVWLKEPGNEQHRGEFIKASNQLNGLPGIISRHVGVVMPSERKVVDDTFDVAMSVTLESEEALQAYLNNPKHKKILHDKIKPLTNRIVAYDFISQ
ncbi:MAG: Dabb family protein [Methylococcales bacterium]|nr:Dabb family protein [Methylococcales bacterium]